MQFHYQQKKAKYGNKKVVVDGVKYDSKKEAMRSQELMILQKKGIIQYLEMQKPFVICPKIEGVKGSRDKKYVCDFFYYDTQIEKFVVEDVKGNYTANLSLFKLKWQLMQHLYPLYEYRIYN